MPALRRAVFGSLKWCRYIPRRIGLCTPFWVFIFLVWLGCVPFFRYADLKVKMAMMEAEKDGEADLKDEWQ